ncbi:MAG: hypothetical protein IMZ46_11925 [Acidobacteria bacterium]|nr:hypothetical protein [Acidobacteriota bacterium]
MSKVDTAINALRLAVATAEALSSALGKAKNDLDSSAAQLKDVLAQVEKDRESMHETIARDRKEARDEFDKKFDGSKDG